MTWSGGGCWWSLEESETCRPLTKLFEREADLRKEQDALKEQWRNIEARVEALEKRTPPAA